MILDDPGGFSLLTGAFSSVVNRRREIKEIQSMRRTIAGFEDGRMGSMSHEIQLLGVENDPSPFLYILSK